MARLRLQSKMNSTLSALYNPWLLQGAGPAHEAGDECDHDFQLLKINTSRQGHLVGRQLTILQPDQGNGRQKMEQKDRTMQCNLCGYTASGKFVGDICPQCSLTYWKCHNCSFTFTAPGPPEQCPQCNEQCDFLNVTCYTPDCGGPGHIDPRL